MGLFHSCLLPVGSGSEELRRRQRVEANQRLADRVGDMRQKMRQHEQKGLESHWSVSWLLLGFVVVVSYCVYYVLSK